MEYYYTYMTKNLTKNKKYLGQHCTRDLEDGYVGSNDELKNDIANGDEYEVEILQFYDDVYQLGDAEYDLLTLHDVYNESKFYNTYKTRFYNLNFVNGLSTEHKQKISDTLTGRKNGPHTEETKKKIGDGNRGKKMTQENVERQKKLVGEKAPMWGKSQSEETRKKQSEAQRGTKNHQFGKPKSPETIAKQKATWAKKRALKLS